jgi:hypothetical protein
MYSLSELMVIYKRSNCHCEARSLGRGNLDDGWEEQIPSSGKNAGGEEQPHRNGNAGRVCVEP